MEYQGLHQQLETLSCHFTWAELAQTGPGRTVEMDIADLEEDYEEDECFEVQWCNLKGYCNAKQKHFEEASHFFQKALERSTTDDQKIVTLSCMAWLPKESQEGAKESLDKVNRILNGRRSESIPEVMAEKAFAIMKGGGFTPERFQEARRCIDVALKDRPGNIAFKFTKAKCMQKLLLTAKKVISPDDTEVKDVDQIWKDLREQTMKKHLPNLQAQVSICYALFQNKVHYDFGKSGQKYADEAEQLCGSNHSVLRKLAQFYIQSNTAGNDTSKMYKAAKFLRILLKAHPDSRCDLSLYGQLLMKKYRCDNRSPRHKERIFLMAEENLQKAWCAKKKYIIPALDLCHLYDSRCEQSGDYEAAVSTQIFIKLDNLFNELLCASLDCENSFAATLYSTYACYVKKYGHGAALVKMHLSEFEQFSKTRSRRQDTSMQEELQEAIQVLQQYEETQRDELLCKADMMFRSVQETLEIQEDHVKATFHERYADFLNRFAKDLAICYLKKSLQVKPYQKPKFSYDPLEKLAKEKIASNNEDKKKGEEILEWMQDLKKQHNI